MGKLWTNHNSKIQKTNKERSHCGYQCEVGLIFSAGNSAVSSWSKIFEEHKNFAFVLHSKPATTFLVTMNFTVNFQHVIKTDWYQMFKPNVSVASMIVWSDWPMHDVVDCAGPCFEGFNVSHMCHWSTLTLHCSLKQHVDKNERTKWQASVCSFCLLYKIVCINSLLQTKEACQLAGKQKHQTHVCSIVLEIRPFG